MRGKPLFRRELLLVQAACVALLCGSAHADGPRVEKAAAAPALTPLPMATGGRMLVTQSGEAEFGGRAFAAQWPGAYFRAAFEGNEVFLRVGKSEEILHIVVDDGPAMLLTKPEPGVYEVQGLHRGRHAIGVFVATESQAEPNTFDGFGIPAGEKALKPAPRRRQIEFIGDSHTVGYGDLSAKRECTEDEVWADTDDTQAFGALIARHYDADYQVNAISGRGVVRNYNGFAADTLPEAYPYILFDKAQRSDDAGWKPEVMVIALGTNDFTTRLNPGERWKTRDALHADFEATYARFLEGLRARNPHALMIVWATDMVGGEIETEAQKVVRKLEEQGEGRIEFLPVDGLSFSACNWHPSLADHRMIAGEIERVIDADRQVWQGR